MAEEAKKRQRRPALGAALKQVSRAGLVAKSASIAPDGTVLIEFGKHADAQSAAGKANPWDEVLIRDRH